MNRLSWHVGAFCFVLSACASRVEIISLPEGAEIRTQGGEVLGKTPLELSDEQESKIVESGIASFRLSAPGRESRLVLADASGLRRIQVALPKVETTLFKSEMAQDYSKDINKVLRDAFEVQRLLMERKGAELQTRVESFKKDYPQAAFGYLLSAQIAISQGKVTEARAALERAKALDPDDPSIDQNLKLMKRSGP
jgi:hypothetical protein